VDFKGFSDGPHLNCIRHDGDVAVTCVTTSYLSPKAFLLSEEASLPCIVAGFADGTVRMYRAADNSSSSFADCYVKANAETAGT